jgi:hypothetical protein
MPVLRFPFPLAVTRNLRLRLRLREVGGAFSKLSQLQKTSIPLAFIIVIRGESISFKNLSLPISQGSILGFILRVSIQVLPTILSSVSLFVFETSNTSISLSAFTLPVA